jgi:2'-5' RNA ligase
MPNLPMPEGLTPPDLECVMLDLQPLHVMKHVGPQRADDLFFGTTPELKYAQGAVAEKTAHVTLLFGIHPSPSYRRNVDAVLKDWKIPLVEIDHVGFFPSPDPEQDYYVIVGHVKRTPELLEGNARLATLDHTNRYPEYAPHVTLAYIKGEAELDWWINRLNDIYKGQVFGPTGLNYGDESDV